MSQKAENLLNLALDATKEEREKSLELEVGYHPGEREWDLIVKYSGSLEAVRRLASSVTEMANEYAVITISESQLDALAQIPEIDYIEKPKRLFFQVTNGKRVSCINEIQRIPFSFGVFQEGVQERNANQLYGRGVLTAIVDSGIDYTLPDFRYPDGSTRIRALWDQSIQPMEGETAPEGYAMGVEYTKEQIDEALLNLNSTEWYRKIRSRDVSGHGTAVAGIVAGNAGKIGGYQGVAPASELLVVKMGNPREGGFPRTTELIQGVDYVIRKALEYRMPVAVNLSFGNTYGSHEPYN